MRRKKPENTFSEWARYDSFKNITNLGVDLHTVLKKSTKHTKQTLASKSIRLMMAQKFVIV